MYCPAPAWAMARFLRVLILLERWAGAMLSRAMRKARMAPGRSPFRSIKLPIFNCTKPACSAGLSGQGCRMQHLVTCHLRGAIAEIWPNVICSQLASVSLTLGDSEQSCAF